MPNAIRPLPRQSVSTDPAQRLTQPIRGALTIVPLTATALAATGCAAVATRAMPSNPDAPLT